MSRSYSQSASALAFAIAFISLDPQPGNAQAGPAVELPPVEVTATGQAPPSETAAEQAAPGPQSLTVPTKKAAAEALRQVPGGTNFIDANQYEQGRAANLDDILRYQPGVYVGSRGDNGEPKIAICGVGLDRTFDVRGIKLLQDGIPITPADGNGSYGWIEPNPRDQCDAVYRRHVGSVDRFHGGGAALHG